LNRASRNDFRRSRAPHRAAPAQSPPRATASRPRPAPQRPRAHATRGPALRGRPFSMLRACRGGLERRAAIQPYARPRGPAPSPGPRVPEVPRASDGPLVLGTCLRVAYIGRRPCLTCRHLPVRAPLPRPSRRRRAGHVAEVSVPFRPAACISTTSSTPLRPKRSSPTSLPEPSAPSTSGTAAAAAAFTGRRRAARRSHHRPGQGPKSTLPNP
jgi:hypothetical protein